MITFVNKNGLVKYTKNVSIVILFCCINIMSSCDNGNKNNKLEENIYDKFGVNPCLLKLIKVYNRPDNSFSRVNFNDLNKNDIFSKQMELPNKEENQFYYVIKFFEIYGNLYLSIWQSPCFPFHIQTPQGIVKPDSNNMFYFQIGNVNLIIFDTPESKGYGLFKKKEEYNNAAIMKKESVIKIWEQDGPIITNRDFTYETYLIIDQLIVKVKDVIPPKYKQEKVIEIHEHEKIIDIID